MFSRFFIDRPIFAAVLSIILVLAGGVATFSLSIAQYPNITPPTVEVSAIFPGANAQVISDSVAAPIEQQINGVEGMLYMSSQCTNDGIYTLTVTFNLGVDLNMAQVLVQNREAQAEPVLPELVKRKGVTVRKKSPSTLMIVNLFSPKGTRDNLYLSNYATIQIRDELSRLPGVGDITYLGQRDYSMRVWLNPEKMASLNLSADDVVKAVQEQNVQVAAGQIGQPPVPSGQVFQYAMTTLGRLSSEEQFGQIIVKNTADGRIVRLKEVATIDMGAQAYDQVCTLDRKPSVALSIYQLPGSNALATAAAVRAKMEALKLDFPEDLDYAIVYDTTPFISESILEVVKTLGLAVALVAFVVILFLQNWRSAIIPLLAVPVAIIGTLAAMYVVGFSLNNLTLFGLVLAIGIVVDDAIVVVEAVEHHIEHGLSPRDATIKAMNEVAGPVVAVGLVLTAVFVPCTFITGIMGQFFKQFALTIAVSTILSAFNSLTLSPALAALLLKPKHERKDEVMPWWLYGISCALAGWYFLPYWLNVLINQADPTLLPSFFIEHRSLAITISAIVIGAVIGIVGTKVFNFVLGTAFRWFNIGFNYVTMGYVAVVSGILRISLIALLVYGGLLVLTWYVFQRTPSGFIPAQDKGYLLVNVQLPDSASIERTIKVVQQIEKLVGKTKGVSHTVAIAGQSLLLNANAPNFGSMFVMLDEFSQRTAHDMSADAISARLEELLHSEVKEGVVSIFGAPPVEGLGTAGGFKIMIEDRSDQGNATLQRVADQVVSKGNDTEGIQGLFTSFRADTPWIQLNVDRVQAKTQGVALSEIFGSLQTYLGSLYVNDFNKFGRTWQVNIQAAPLFRKKIEDLRQLKVRNDRGMMVPLAGMLSFKEISGPVMLVRYNMYPSAGVRGCTSPGVSSGQAIDIMDQVMKSELPPTMRPAWTELALLQLQTGNTAVFAFVLAVVLVFLVLAAQYESWSLPLAVILVVPMCLLCSVVGVGMAKMDVNIFTQIGFIVLVGLACKNAILIVEFAKIRSDAGSQPRGAILEACKIRLRPIIMTSFAFILGVVPLVIAEGAGAEMRQTLGVAVFAGMLGVTLFGVFLTPIFFYVIQWSTGRIRRSRT
ncbi:MAG: multidrug efflux RND transporter permease subunit [Gemmatales bacterium]